MSALSVALCADFPEEQWPSMDRVANELVAQMQRGHADTIDLTPYLSAVHEASDVDWSGAVPFSIDRALNRWWDYPRHVNRIAGGFDVFHVVDHSYAQLVHRLPAARTVVTCHDLDTFRSILRPEEEPRSSSSGPRPGESFRAFSARPGLPATPPRSATNCAGTAWSPRSASASPHRG